MSDQPKPRKQDAAIPTTLHMETLGAEKEFPKPTTGEQCCTCGNLGPEQGIPSPTCPVHGHAWSKPATVEWTSKTVLELWQMGGAGCDTNSRMIDIANAHNAALAAEREKVQPLVDALEIIRYKTAEPQSPSWIAASFALAKVGK